MEAERTIDAAERTFSDYKTFTPDHYQQTPPAPSQTL